MVLAVVNAGRWRSGGATVMVPMADVMTIANSRRGQSSFDGGGVCYSQRATMMTPPHHSPYHDAAILAGRVLILPKLKKDFEVAVNTTLWHLWNFKNNAIFSPKCPRKELLLNDIKLSSFTWFLSRNRKCVKMPQRVTTKVPAVTTTVPTKPIQNSSCFDDLTSDGNKKTTAKGVGKEGFGCALNKSKGSHLGLRNCAANRKRKKRKGPFVWTTLLHKWT
ncbi:hypothetical protein Tco_0949832 [Tanacetum coccineum]